jgi:hypothetical protein
MGHGKRLNIKISVLAVEISCLKPAATEPYHRSARGSCGALLVGAAQGEAARDDWE